MNIHWDGKGLPPVGTVCEVENPNEDGKWAKCRILAWDSECAVFVAGGDYPYLYDGTRHPECFRKISTPEDIADQTRQEIIDLAAKRCGIAGDAIRQLATVLAAEGYRKFEIVEEEV